MSSQILRIKPLSTFFHQLATVNGVQSPSGFPRDFNKCAIHMLSAVLTSKGRCELECVWMKINILKKTRFIFHICYMLSQLRLCRNILFQKILFMHFTNKHPNQKIKYITIWKWHTLWKWYNITYKIFLNQFILFLVFKIPLIHMCLNVVYTLLSISQKNWSHSVWRMHTDIWSHISWYFGYSSDKSIFHLLHVYSIRKCDKNAEKNIWHVLLLKPYQR